MKILIVDCETTGIDAEAELLEFAALVRDHDGKVKGHYSALVLPDVSIPPEASAVHNITDDVLYDEGAFTRPQITALITKVAADCDFIAAHNAKFDKQFLPELADHTWICTCTVAKHLWPEAPNYSLGTLRYWRGLNIKHKGVPHRAAYDAVIAAHLLNDELNAVGGDDIDTLVELTNTLPILRVCHFGKHRGTPWAEVPRDYLAWMQRQHDSGQEFDAEVIHTARHYLGKE